MTPEDFENRVFANFDYMRDKLDDLCERQTRYEEKLDAHLDQADRRTVSRRQWVLVVLGVIGSYAVGLFTKLTTG